MLEVSNLKTTLELMEKGIKLAVVTITRTEGSIPGKPGSQMTVLEDGSIRGTIGGGALENRVIELAVKAIKNGKSMSVNLPLTDEGMVCGGEIDVFIQTYTPLPKLIIVGGGHVSLALYEMASLLNFDIVIFEDREQFLNFERFPKAKELVLGPVDKKLKEYDIDENSYIVIVTRGHEYDNEALETVINSKAKYIGAIGSKNKVKKMLDNLKAKGISEDSLSKIYSPIGLNIADNSPAEISISILSEILSVKNDKEIKNMKL